MVWPRAAVIPRHRPAPPTRTMQSTRPTQAKRRGHEQVTRAASRRRGQASRRRPPESGRGAESNPAAQDTGRPAAVGDRPHGQTMGRPAAVGDKPHGQTTRRRLPASHPPQATRVAGHGQATPPQAARAAGHPQATRRRPPAPQATSKGWPYYTRRLHKPHGCIVYSRATPCGWPARGLRRWSHIVYSRATPCGWPATVAGLVRGGWPGARRLAWCAVAGLLVAGAPRLPVTLACGLFRWPARGRWMRRWSTCNPMHMLARVASCG